MSGVNGFGKLEPEATTLARELEIALAERDQARRLVIGLFGIAKLDRQYLAGDAQAWVLHARRCMAEWGRR